MAAVRRFGERSGRLLRQTGSSPAAAAAALAKQAAALRSACQRPLVVGVFMDQALEEVSKTTTTTDVDVVQLHGGERPRLRPGAAGAAARHMDHQSRSPSSDFER